MEKGHLFPTNSTVGESGWHPGARLTPTLSEPNDMLFLKQSAVAAGVPGNFSMHSFASGGGGGFESLSRRRSVHHCATGVLEEPQNGMEVHMQLTQVVSPGSSGYSMVSGNNGGTIQGDP